MTMIARDWKTEENGLVRELGFKDYDEALRFVDEVGREAVDYERRPDVSIVEYNHVRVCVTNLHHVGITAAERRLAQKVDDVLERYPNATDAGGPS
jgi:pterin-4a-carbinolamine dehydratase